MVSIRPYYKTTHTNGKSQQQARLKRPGGHSLSVLYGSCITIQHFLIHEPAGRKWFDCAECHYEQEDHELLQKFEMVHLHQSRAFMLFLTDHRHSPARSVRNVFERTHKSSRRGSLMTTIARKVVLMDDKRRILSSLR